MSDYIVSARKYRPQTFESVVGQESITQTLAKAIENNKLGNAFLFCGPRGVGKTTCARILAREVNKFHSDNPEEDRNFAFNIFELDAASNNGVEAIRDLIDQVRIPPQSGKFKVYIIDEVHMLSTQAFNAFLKTLEEPPAYAIFIMATTEKHKVLPTIISRCQVFDFHRIQINDIVKHLEKIASSENIAAESDALHLIAEKADGALRDALSIFDRMASFSGDKITYQEVIDNLNILDHEYFFRIIDAALAGDRAEALLTYDEIVQAGFEGQNFVSGLANHLRNLLMAVTPKTANIIETGEAIKKRYLEQSRSCTTDALVEGLRVLGEADSGYKASQNQRLLVEIALLKLCDIFIHPEKKNDDPRRTQVDPAAPTRTNAPASPASPPTPTTQASDSSKPTEQPAAPTTANTATESTESDPTSFTPSPTLSATEGETTEKPPTPATDRADTSHDDGGASRVEEPAAQEGSSKGDATVADGSALSEDTTTTPPSETTAPESPAADRNPSANKPPEPKEPAAETSGSSNGLTKLQSGRIKGMTSLKSIRQNKSATGRATTEKTSEDDDFTQQPEGPVEPFNLRELWEAWDAYAKRIKSKDMQSYYATLTKHRPVMREPYDVEFLVDNHVQLADLDQDRQNLLDFLRGRLQNRRIQLKGILAEDDNEEEDKPYDPRKKFLKMKEVNPNLDKLRKTFDLDIEHD